MDDVLALARTLEGEAGNQGRQGKIAVASVILNRFKLKKWNAGKTIKETCLFCVKGQPYHQFSCWNDFDPVYKRIKDLQPEGMKESFDIAQDVIAGRIQSNVGLCTHYHTTKVAPKWSRGKLPAYKIGDHVFFDNVD